MCDYGITWSYSFIFLLSQFMRIYEKCNIPHTHFHQLKWYSAFCRNPIFLMDHNMKIISTLYRFTVRSYTNFMWHNNTDSCCNLSSGKRDPSENREPTKYENSRRYAKLISFWGIVTHKHIFFVFHHSLNSIFVPSPQIESMES